MTDRPPATSRLPILAALFPAAVATLPASAAEPPAPAPARPPTIEAPNLFQAGWRDPRYAIPDLAEDRVIIPRVNTRFLTIRPGIELILDHTAFAQDSSSIAQVGRQDDRLEVRSASLEFAG